MDDLSIDGLRNRIEEYSSKLSDTQRRAGLTSIVHTAATQLSPQVADWLGVSTNELSKHVGTISVSPYPMVNGKTYRPSGSRAFNIEIYEGLMIFFHKIFKLFLTRMGVMDETSEPIEHPSLPFDQVGRLTIGLMKAFWDGTHDSADSVSISALSDSQAFMEGLLLLSAERFVVAHEFGHIIAHFKPDLYEVKIASELARQALRAVPFSSSQAVVQNWSAEFAADLIGA